MFCLLFSTRAADSIGELLVLDNLGVDKDVSEDDGLCFSGLGGIGPAVGKRAFRI